MFTSSSKSGSTSFLGGEEKSNNPLNKIPGFEEEPACAKMCPQLTYQQRLIGFVASASLGWTLSIIGTLILFGGTSAANIRIFIVFYVLGNVIALCSTGFLLGPRAQCTKMWAITRRWSTAFYLAMLVIVFAVAVSGQNIFLILFLLVIEIMAGAWYSLSYVPFGRKIFMAFLRKTGACMPCFYVYDAVKAKYDEHQKANAPTVSQRMGVTEKKDTSFSGRMSGMLGRGGEKV
mmetsp:Transcript_77298/g.151662  ORF Transcript_77298/g.151662 Transcript_77298/m.151662 type:complete len:233 (+) Transcript_77298:90-788(+)|eukprot:CAMPEP_0170370940 /NCGR_PEP_ID=MMETSP0117_2-20130122/8774_1 /TAXON_ID=400756 /ORGANISM="Durinskia baltica, Strain CSIRO CS-38" /LENGTH=232 /DNA_ID=CAMNT_0010625739 /DNA_START=87 /DNA_END=785 /DNA_ORIENTATION=+